MPPDRSHNSRRRRFQSARNGLQQHPRVHRAFKGATLKPLWLDAVVSLPDGSPPTRHYGFAGPVVGTATGAGGAIAVTRWLNFAVCSGVKIARMRATKSSIC